MHVKSRATRIFLSVCLLSLPYYSTEARSLRQGQTLAQPLIETVWNKPSHQYKYGDQFTVTLVPRQKSFVYLFYISNDDKVMAIYPSRMVHKHTAGSHEPMEISTIKSSKREYALRVDSTPGKMVSAAIKDNEQGKLLKEQLISHADWAAIEPQEHTLKLSGHELLERLKGLSDKSSDLYFSIEDAPKAQPESSPKPKRPNGIAGSESGV